MREQATLDQKRVLDTALDGYLLLDSDGRLLDMKDAYCRMTGYSREELLRMHIPDLEAKEVTLEQVREHLARIIEQGADLFETIHRRKDGSLVDVEIATTYWKDSRHFFAFARVISERTRIQKALTESKEQYDRLVSNIPVGVYLLRTTPSGVFQFKYISPRLSKILGVWSAAIYADAQAAFDPIHPDDLPGFVALNQQAVRTHQDFLWEGRIVRDGQTRWLRIGSKPELQENGDCIWDGMAQDITEQRQARLALDLEQARLAEAQKVGHFGSWELDLASGKLVWSDEIFEIFEIDKEKFAASYEAFLNAIHPDDREKVNQAYTEWLADRQPYQITQVGQATTGSDGVARIAYDRPAGARSYDTIIAVAGGRYAAVSNQWSNGINIYDFGVSYGFMGEHSFEVLGDYLAGPSHVMPTGGSARFASPLNVWDSV